MSWHIELFSDDCIATSDSLAEGGVQQIGAGGGDPLSFADSRDSCDGDGTEQGLGRTVRSGPRRLYDMSEASHSDDQKELQFTFFSHMDSLLNKQDRRCRAEVDR